MSPEFVTMQEIGTVFALFLFVLVVVILDHTSTESKTKHCKGCHSCNEPCGRESK